MSWTGLRSRRASWLVPVGVAAAVALGAGVAPMVAGAATPLPKRSAAQLLADLADAPGSPFSGTVVETARLGFPALPNMGNGNSSTSLSSLITGSHTARIWYAGPQQVRFALVGDLAETDLIRNGRDLWVWTSRTNTAEHAALTGSARSMAPDAGPATPATPQQAAQQALSAVNPTTAVSVDGTADVAGRSAYELVLRPRDARSLVGQVRIAVDSRTSTPLRVRVYAAGHTTPAFETGFTSVRFARPDAAIFRFAPPPGAKVSQLDLTGSSGRSDTAAHRGTAPTVIGTGWTSVLVFRGVNSAAGGSSAELATVLRSTTTVSGSFGTGRLLRTALLSAVLLDDGRLLVGAVTPQTLLAAANEPAAGVHASAAPKR